MCPSKKIYVIMDGMYVRAGKYMCLSNEALLGNFFLSSFEFILGFMYLFDEVSTLMSAYDFFLIYLRSH